jgi:prevent-host-death family protein
MSKTWRIQEAKTRFDEFLQASLAEGPQIVAEDGVEMAALLPIEHWRRLEKTPRRSLKELLLAQEARTDALVPPRVNRPRRQPPTFD